MTAWRQSGQTLTRFAKERGLPAGRLYYWRDTLAREEGTRVVKRRSRPATAPKLVPVVLREENDSRADNSGRVVASESTGEIDPVWVARFVRALIGTSAR